MLSTYWNKRPQDAYENPWDYSEQKLFLKEAHLLLERMKKSLNQFNLKFKLNEETLAKANWMLAQEIADVLFEILFCLKNKRHRIAGRMFRGCIETIDLMKILNSAVSESGIYLKKWYENETVKHSSMRAVIRRVDGGLDKANRKDLFRILSKLTHRTYVCLLESYSLGRDNLIIHESCATKTILVLPQVIASHLALLGQLILEACETLKLSETLKVSNVTEGVWSKKG